MPYKFITTQAFQGLGFGKEDIYSGPTVEDVLKQAFGNEVCRRQASEQTTKEMHHNNTWQIRITDPSRPSGDPVLVGHMRHHYIS